ncbi:MAG: hypothetical protein HN348_36150 [Proteobacteria bacterium]|nr:hypothetical protein [Pseudomonadota bacterium]
MLYTLALGLTATATLALMVATNISIGHANLFVLTTALGVGVDAIIHLVVRMRESDWQVAMSTTGIAVVWNCGLLAAGLVVMQLSQFKTMSECSLLLMVALTVNLAATLLVLAAGHR